MIFLVFVALVLGFAAGFITFKRSNRWCTSCGAKLRCEACNAHLLNMAEAKR